MKLLKMYASRVNDRRKKERKKEKENTEETAMFPFKRVNDANIYVVHDD